MKTKFFIVAFACTLFATLSADLFAQSGARATAQTAQRQTVLGAGAANTIPIDNLDHAPFNELLQRYVDTNGDVDYAGWKASAGDMQALDNYINTLSSASLQQASARENQMALWINAYNAVTIKGILQEYPTTSIRNHTSETGGYNIWKGLYLNIGGHQVTLDSIEHKALRPMGDPRIHFAIVCASKGCPRLLNEAYVGRTLDAQLTTNTQHFFSVPQNFQYDAQRRQFKMSSIMQWFGSDFGQGQAAQLNAIAPYLPASAQAAARSNAVSVSYLDYSWDLNAQPKKAMVSEGSETRPAQPVGGSQPRQGSQPRATSGSNRR